MSGYQKTLDDGVGIAEELASNQRSISIAEFFEKNKHMLGFDSNARSIITAVKEGVDNALDATEEAGILPTVLIDIQESGDYYSLVIEDNGPGIPLANISKVFGKLLYGSRFGSMTQSRGQQGIGISAAVLYSQLTSGKPAKITSKPKGKDKAHYIELTLNTDTNEPKVQTQKTIDWDRHHGTRIEIEMEANMRARSQLYDYIKNTAVVNPHAKVTFDEPSRSEPLVYERVVDELPQNPTEIKPHPHGVELGHVMKMLESTDSHSLSGFLQTEFCRVGNKSAETIIDHFRDDWYGREVAVNVEIYERDADKSLDFVIDDAVTRKPAEAKSAFSKNILNQIHDTNRASHGELASIVEVAADEVENNHGTRFGATVREKTHEALWDAIETYRAKDIVSVVREATHTRKDEQATNALGRVVASRIEQQKNTRFTRDELKEHIEAGAREASERHGETFGDTSQQKIFDAIWSITRTVSEDPPLVRKLTGDRSRVSSLLYGMTNASISRPSTKCLSPITPEKIEAGLRKEYDAEFYSAASRDAGVHSGHPFIVEAGLVYGGEVSSKGSIDVLRYANRVPLVYQPGACGITKTIKQIGWRNYKLKQSGGSGLPDGPVKLMVHVASTNVPFTSESKDALASVPEIEHEVEQAVRSVSRDLKKFLKKRSKIAKRQRKQNVIAEILPVMANKLAETVETDSPDTTGSLARIMNNVLVNCQKEDDVTLTVTNFSNTSEQFKISHTFTDEPTVATGDVEVIQAENEYRASWDGKVSSGETLTLSFETENTDGSLLVENIEDEKVTVIN